MLGQAAAFARTLDGLVGHGLRAGGHEGVISQLMLSHDSVQWLHAHVALDFFFLSHVHPLIPQTVLRNLNSSHEHPWRPIHLHMARLIGKELRSGLCAW